MRSGRAFTGSCGAKVKVFGHFSLASKIFSYGKMKKPEGLDLYFRRNSGGACQNKNE